LLPDRNLFRRDLGVLVGQALRGLDVAIVLRRNAGRRLATLAASAPAAATAATATTTSAFATLLVTALGGHRSAFDQRGRTLVDGRLLARLGALLGALALGTFLSRRPVLTLGLVRPFRTLAAFATLALGTFRTLLAGLAVAPRFLLAGIVALAFRAALVAILRLALALRTRLR